MKFLARTLSVVLLGMALPLAAQASMLFQATMLGSNETTPNASTATGTSWVTLHDDMNTLDVFMIFNGLTTPASASHIHCCAVQGVNAPVRLDFGGAAGFPTGVTEGLYSHTFLLSGTTLGGGMSAADFLTGLIGGLAYTNIHNSRFPGGEIRGQLVRIPEPASLSMLGLGLLGFGWSMRKRAAQHS